MAVDGRKLIFVVDDDPGMRKSIAVLLDGLGFSAELYASAEAFLSTSKFSQARDSCVILDIHLDGMSGIELASRLAGAGHALPIIFITGNDSESVRTAARRQDYIAYLTKPFTAKALADAIDLALA
jgi:FixJ family two-component response regulator